MRTEQNNSTDWKKVRLDYEAGILSIRKLAERYGVSDTAIRKRAKKEVWEPFGSASEGVSSHREPPQNLPAIPEIVVEAASKPLSIARRGRDIVERLLDELDAMTSHLGELEDMIIDETRGDKDSRKRNAMLRAISHGTRTMAAKNLALALRTYDEAAPGKKQQAQEAAETAGVGTEWGDDLNIGIAN